MRYKLDPEDRKSLTLPDIPIYVDVKVMVWNTHTYSNRHKKLKLLATTTNKGKQDKCTHGSLKLHQKLKKKKKIEISQTLN